MTTLQHFKRLANDEARAGFHDAWESAQRKLGAVLSAFHARPFNRPLYREAVSAAAYAVAELENHPRE